MDIWRQDWETTIPELSGSTVSGMANSRMKDFYDVWTLARKFAFDGLGLCAAIRATFQRRQTALLTTTPLALTPEFSDDRRKATQWSAFVRKAKLIESPPPFAEVITLLASFLMPPMQALASNASWNLRWLPVEWQPASTS